MPLDVVSHSSPATFLDRAAPFLMAREIEHSLLLGVAGNLCEQPPNASHDWLTVEDQGRVVGAAMRTQPHEPVLSCMTTAGVQSIVRYFVQKEVTLTGVFGQTAETVTFSRGWSEANRCLARISKRIALAACSQPTASSLKQSHTGSILIRRPDPADCDRIARFLVDFHRDVDSPPPADPITRAVEMIESGTLRVVDVQGEVVCCANVGRETSSTATITLVYTHPEGRGRGYASACVRSLTSEILASGKRASCLYFNTADPIASHVYRTIGYKPIAEYLWWAFLPKTAHTHRE